MAGTNDFKSLATGVGANVLTQAEYEALASLLANGFTSGVADSKTINKALRQSSFVAEAIAKIIADNNVNALDDGDVATFKANLLAAIWGSATTPPQFDNDTSLATTAFVQRAIGNRQNNTELSSATALTAADAGKWINLSGGTAYTVTLPNISSVAAGAEFIFHNDGGFPCTVQRYGSNTIAIAGGMFPSVSIGPGEFLVVSAQGGLWRTAGSAVLKNEGQFGSSLAASGYQKLPSGLIIQWGVSGGVPNGGSLTITLPITMPGLIASVATSYNGNSPSVGNPHSTNIVSASQFQIYNSGSTTATYRWIAIGY